jgi:two-component system LytT family response regulator
MKCIIIDDEYPARMELRYFIEKYEELEIVGEFEDSISALSFFEQNSVDIIFLDINMPNMNGMVLAKLISKFETKPQIIFITAYGEYAVDAFSIKAFDYILKPYSEERIIKTLDSLIEKSRVEKPKEEKSINRLTLWKGEKMYVLSLDEIYIFEACDRETKVYAKGEIYFSKQKISNLEEELPDMFFRTHRSYIVNINKIKEIIPWFNSTYNLKIEGLDIEVPVSRNKIKEFRSLLNIK